MPGLSTFRRRLVLISITAVAAPAVVTAMVVRLAPTDDESADQLARLSAIGEAFGTVSAGLCADRGATSLISELAIVPYS